MFTFLQTSMLLGLAGVAIPILIHLFAKQKVQKIYFSSVAFLKKIHTQRMRSMKLRQWLLLALRCLAILFLVLAFARPTIKSASRTTGGGASSVLLVDRSMSMGEGNLFSRARDRARSILDLTGDEDEVALIWLGGEPGREVSFTRDPRILERQLAEGAASAERGRMREAFQAAADLLAASRNLNREVFVVGDLQATGFEGMQDTLGAWDGNVFFLPLERSAENAGIVDCGVENRILQPGAPLRVFAIVKNFGTRGIERLLVRHSLNGRAVAQEEIDLEAGEEKRVSFRILSEESGWMHGVFRLDADALPTDDERFFSAWIPERIRVLLVGNGSEDILPFRRCLQPLGGGVVFEMEQSVNGEEWTGKLGGADVVLLGNPPSLRQDEADALGRFVEEGGGVFLWMGDAVDVRSLHERFLNPLGLTLGNVLGGDEGGFYSFESLDYGHPLFQGVFEEGMANARSPRFFRIIEMIAGPRGRIGTLTGDRPWLVERSLGRGRILVAATGIGEAWSDIAYTTFFAPLITRGVVYLASPEVEEGAPLVGDALRWERRVESVSTDYRVEDPRGEFVRVLPDVAGDRVRLVLDRTEQTGVYTLSRGEALLGLKAVNIDPAESDLRRMSEEEVESLFPEARLVFVEEGEGLEAAVERIRWGRELWREMLLLGLLVLIVELAVAREGRRS